MYSIRIKYIWLSALFPVLFISDILYGGMNYYGVDLVITPGVILRGGIIAIAAFMVIRHRYLVGGVLFIWLVLLIVFALPSLIVGIVQHSDIIYDVQTLFKVLYLPFVAGLIVVLINRYQINQGELLRYMEYSAYFLGISLLISQSLGIQRLTYGDYAFGNTGIFYAQNDLTLAFGMSLLAAGYRIIMVRASFLRGILFLQSIFACLQIGTRASLAVVMVLILTFTVMMVWGRSKKQSINMLRILMRWLFAVLFVAGLVWLLLYGLGRHVEHGYQHQKLEAIASGDLPRQLLIIAGNTHLTNRAPVIAFTGEGMDAFQRGVASYFPSDKERKFVEVDWIDLYGAYGMVFVVVIYMFFLFIFVGSTRRFLVGARDPIDGLISAAVLLYIAHSVTAGHALTSPIPATLMAGYLAIDFIQKQYMITRDESNFAINYV